jgi:hypothetical protein
MRVKGEGVSNCAKCHKSDWSRRFLFPESEADRTQREAREARRQELEAIRLSCSSSDEETADSDLVDHDGFTYAERHQREQEELIQRVRDEESTKWAKGVVIGFVALLLLIMWARAGEDERGNPNEPTCQYAGRSMDCW